MSRRSISYQNHHLHHKICIILNSATSSYLSVILSISIPHLVHTYILYLTLLRRIFNFVTPHFILLRRTFSKRQYLSSTLSSNNNLTVIQTNLVSSFKFHHSRSLQTHDNTLSCKSQIYQMSRRSISYLGGRYLIKIIISVIRYVLF